MAWFKGLGKLMRKVAFTGFGVTLLFILAMAVVFYLNFKTVIVSGPSMEKTFKSGDRLLSSRAYWLIGPIQKKDVIVIHNEDGKGYIIKRVCYMPGEKVDMWNSPRSDIWSIANGQYVVPEGMYYVLGDNRPVSEDSRAFGPIKKERVLGKIILLPDTWVQALGVVLAALAGFIILVYGITTFINKRMSRA